MMKLQRQCFYKIFEPDKNYYKALNNLGQVLDRNYEEAEKTLKRHRSIS